MTPFKLTIQEPCYEKWNEMSAKDKGRFCNVCDKTVVDFTNKTPDEISNYLEKSTGKVCGRFNTNDLDKVHVPQPVIHVTSKNTGKWLAWLTVFAFLGFGKKTEAQLVTNYTADDEKESDQLIIKKGHTIIKGMVKHSDTKTGITEVEIKIYSGGKIITSTKTIENGSYFINLPEGSVFDFKIDVEYNAVNYQSKLLKDIPVNKNEIYIDALITEKNKKEESQSVALKIESMVMDMPYEIRYEKSMGLIIRTQEAIETKLFSPLSISKQTEVEHHLMGAVVQTMVCENSPLLIAEPINPIANDPAVRPVNVEPTIQIQAYPNPTTNYFTVDVENATQVSIQLFDLDGKMIQYFSSQESKNIIDLTFQPNGTYIIRVIDDASNKSVEKKIIKTY